MGISLIYSCAKVNAPSGNGVIFTEASEIIYYDPYIKPNQKITMCHKNIAGFVSNGAAGFDALRLKSQIRKIATIEKTYSSRLSLIGESCTIVTGE